MDETIIPNLLGSEKMIYGMKMMGMKKAVIEIPLITIQGRKKLQNKVVVEQAAAHNRNGWRRI